jgi:exopolysaccharide biosynthesis polyprenyl glycosylphosphotransferase
LLIARSTSPLAKSKAGGSFGFCSMNTAIKIKKIILLLGDVAILYFSLWLSLVVRYGQTPDAERWGQHLLPFSLIFLVWLVVFFINGLYDPRLARNGLEFYSNILKTIIWCAALAVAFFYLFQIGIAPKTNLILQLVIFSALFAVWRHSFNKIVKTQALLSQILIIGANPATIALAAEINTKPHHGFKVAAVFEETESLLTAELRQAAATAGLSIISGAANLFDFVIDHKVSLVVSAVDLRHHPEILGTLYRCLPLKTTFLDLPTFLEQFTNKIPVNTIGQIWFLENIKENDKTIYEFGKRIFDILVALLILIVSLPFLPLLYAVVKINSHGPFLFKQIRTGKNGHRFLAIKIRTMHKNAEINGPQWAQKNDARVTRSGRFLRKTRIDEIPQLFNILRGEMSFIGPRPERPEFVEKLSLNIPFYNQRNLVKPGLTGWAQINFPYGASEADALEKLQYDLYYIKNRSFMLDLSILLKTIKTVLSGGGQ